jgi:hypothetical protein
MLDGILVSVLIADFQNRIIYKEPKMPGQWLFKVVPVLIGIGFIIIICVWIGTGILTYQAVKQGPEGLGHAIGQVIKGINEGKQ